MGRYIEKGAYEKAKERACVLLSMPLDTDEDELSNLLYEDFGIGLHNFIYLLSKIEPILNKKKDEND